MEYIAIACQVAVAIVIFNVWVVRRNRPTPYRPDGARDMKEEFERYGFPGWALIAVGTLKLSLAVLLLVGIAFAHVALPAAALMAVLMLSAVAAHIRVRDPLVKAAPALGMLVLSTFIAVAHGT